MTVLVLILLLATFCFFFLSRAVQSIQRRLCIRHAHLDYFVL